MSSMAGGFDMNKLKDRNYKGDDFKVNKKLGEGPFNERKCTDALMCIVFMVFLGGMGFCTAWGYQNGNPGKLIAPIDGDGNICGITPGYEDYQYLFIADIDTVVHSPTNAVSIFYYGVCAKACPETAADSMNNYDCKTTTRVRTCNQDAVSSYAASSLIGYCVPEYDTLSEHVQEDYEAYEEQLYEQIGGQTAKDLYDSRYVILGSFGTCLLTVFIWIFMMDKAAVYLAWISVALIQVSLILAGWGAWHGRKEILADDDATNDEYAQWLWWTAIITWIFAGIWYIFMACNFHSLQVSIAVIETAADWFADTKRIMAVPFLYFGIGGIVFVGWVGCMVCVSSIGEITVDSISAQQKTVEWDDATWNMAIYMWFGLFWITAFLMACNEFVVIVSTATWYFSRKDIPDDDGIPGDSEVWKGFWWSIRYHTGTLAFGSLLIAIVWVIKSVFEYVGNKVQDADPANCLTKGLLCVIRCCLDCFDRFMRFINQNAYIYCALSNENFCSSALNAFILVLKNAAKFSFVNAIGGVFMYIGKFCIAVMSTVLCYFIMLQWTPQVKSIFLPLTCCFVISYVLGSIFISVFDAASNTILQCYLVDLDIASQNGLDPKHVPETLAKFLLHHHGGKTNDDDFERQGANRIQ